MILMFLFFLFIFLILLSLLVLGLFLANLLLVSKVGLHIIVNLLLRLLTTLLQLLRSLLRHPVGLCAWVCNIGYVGLELEAALLALTRTLIVDLRQNLLVVLSRVLTGTRRANPM